MFQFLTIFWHTLVECVSNNTSNWRNLQFCVRTIFQGQLYELTSNNTPNWQNLQFCVWAIFQVAPEGPHEKHFELAKLDVSRSNNFLSAPYGSTSNNTLVMKQKCFMPKQFFKVNS